MLDKTVPFYELLMMRPAGAPAYDAPLPKGYVVASYVPGDEVAWARIVTSVGEMETEADALTYFAAHFAPHPQELARRCLFAVNPSGEKVGTLTAWFAQYEGAVVPRLHWLAVMPSEQGKGLAKALVARVLELFARLHPGAPSYLTTQTWSHVAIRLYERAGYLLQPEGAMDGEENQYRQGKYILDCIAANGGAPTAEQLLNQPCGEDRLGALRGMDLGGLPPLSGVYVNNHIHTIYSFSPYSPTLAVYRARLAGLPTAGIMDHDSVSGAHEFARAGEMLGVLTTTGLECRASLAGTPFADRLINNPDQRGNAYMAMHGIPQKSLGAVTRWLEPIRAARERRNRAMTDRLDGVLAKVGAHIDYDRDVVPLSQWDRGGSVTERHICSAASHALLKGHGRDVLSALEALGVAPGEKIRGYLTDEGNPYRLYDLLGLLKSDLVQSFYLPAQEECPPLSALIGQCHEVGAIAAYPYLGDVGDSVTGDKKAQAFEDAYLDELFAYLKASGVDAITYMPTRNTPAQLARLRALCQEYGFFEISGEDINSPRQSFICPALERPEYAHLRTATYALIGHERSASADLGAGMFAEDAKRAYPELPERVAAYARIGGA